MRVSSPVVTGTTAITGIIATMAIGGHAGTGRGTMGIAAMASGGMPITIMVVAAVAAMPTMLTGRITSSETAIYTVTARSRPE